MKNPSKFWIEDCKLNPLPYIFWGTLFTLAIVTTILFNQLPWAQP